MDASPIRLSKSRFMAGLQCHKQLWWRVHERESTDLEADLEQQALFHQGTTVGERARTYVPGGVLIDFPHDAYEAKIAATQGAIRNGAKVIYEASFHAADVFVAVDILEKTRMGWRVIEVKSTTRVKEQHLPDLAVQVYVLRQAGLEVVSAELMHLNPRCRFPDLANLFEREDFTPEVEALLTKVPGEIASQRTMLEGPVPEISPGKHCTAPYECPFLDRCAPTLPEHHLATLYRISEEKLGELRAMGYQTVRDLPSDLELPAIQHRQSEAVRSGQMVVGTGLGEALSGLDRCIAFLDFETVGLAIPVWAGCHPYEPVPVQFSCHVPDGNGGTRHFEWIADGPQDPRPALADALLEATDGVDCVIAYHSDFEKQCIDAIADALPDRARALNALAGRLRDLLPIVRENVYHPDFFGSFSLKAVLPALVPELDYSDLKIRGGMLASVELARLMFRAETMSADQRETVRSALLKYCHRDTWGMVKLMECLRSAATRSSPSSGKICA